MRRAGCSHLGGDYSVGDTTYRFVQVRPKRFFGTEKVWTGEARIAVTDLERTLLDGLSMPQYLRRLRRGSPRLSRLEWLN